MVEAVDQRPSRGWFFWVFFVFKSAVTAELVISWSFWLLKILVNVKVLISF